jgi:HTH-type transcriptional regulator, sugar sensing transcriptional regulator
MLDSTGQIALRLTQLGFSQYEARTYVGLLAAHGSTGYGVSNETGVPQPKVYETLRRLVERGAVVQTGQRPARYAAVPPAELLARVEADFRSRLDAARQGLESLPGRSEHPPLLPVSRLDSFPLAAARAAEAIGRARTRVHLHGGACELRPLGDAVAAASDRGVQFVIVHLGALPFERPRGQVVGHASLRASRKVLHLAVVVDSTWSLWALARDGERWEGLHSDSPVLASLVETYVRHDLFVQRTCADAPEAPEAGAEDAEIVAEGAS